MGWIFGAAYNLQLVCVNKQRGMTRSKPTASFG